MARKRCLQRTSEVAVFVPECILSQCSGKRTARRKSTKYMDLNYGAYIHGKPGSRGVITAREFTNYYEIISGDYYI